VYFKGDTMARIAIWADDADKAELEAHLLEFGHISFRIREEEVLADRSPFGRPDLIVLDIDPRAEELPRITHELKGHTDTRDIPLLLLIQEGDVPSFDPALGADDFLVKPYRPSVLEARIRLLIWRNEGARTSQVIRIGDVTMDHSRYEVRVKGYPVRLTYKEYELLRCLSDAPGRVMTRETLLDRVWGYDYYGGVRTVDVHIRRLRAKLTREGQTLIQTVRGVGYKLDRPSDESA